MKIVDNLSVKRSRVDFIIKCHMLAGNLLSG